MLNHDMPLAVVAGQPLPIGGLLGQRVGRRLIGRLPVAARQPGGPVVTHGHLDMVRRRHPAVHRTDAHPGVREALGQGLTQRLDHRRIIEVIHLGPLPDAGALLHHQRQLREPDLLADDLQGRHDVPRAEIIHAHHQLPAGLPQKRCQLAPPRIRAHVRYHAHLRGVPAQLGVGGRHILDRSRRGRALGKHGLRQRRAADQAQQILGQRPRDLHRQPLERLRQRFTAQRVQLGRCQLSAHTHHQRAFVRDPAVAKQPAQPHMQHVRPLPQRLLRVCQHRRQRRCRIRRSPLSIIHALPLRRVPESPRLPVAPRWSGRT